MSKVLSHAEQVRLEQAETLLRQGRTGQGIAALQAFIRETPDQPIARYQLAVALLSAGDQPGAERELRATLSLDPSHANAAIRLASLLTPRREAEEAAAILAPFVNGASADLALLTAYALALKTLGRADEAMHYYERAVAAAPTSGLAEHNLAGALGDAQRLTESVAATRRAFAKGLDAPETWLVQGRSLQGLGDLDGAEAAYREALRRRPIYAEAHTELAQLIWMRTEDLRLASQMLDTALAGRESDPQLSVAKARLLEYAGDEAAALAALNDALARFTPDANVLVAASHLAAGQDPTLALHYAEQAVTAAPHNWAAKTALCQANLGLGRAKIAANLAEALCRDWPLDQFPVALLGTAWRMSGDPRYRDLYNYDRLVLRQTVDTPPGWTTLQDYLRDLAGRLRDLQTLRAHPIGQSLRHGSQTGQSLSLSNDPVIKAFFTAIDAPIRNYIAVLREVDDLLGRRARDGYKIAGAWSAFLRPGGFHVNHLHPQGWISSACHIELPETIEQGHQGWLQFGEPGLPTNPPLPPEHFVKPVAGTLVLFPSYMWHGTVPFSGQARRLTVAFDVLPS